MGSSSPIINSFNAGELSPKMAGRSDFAKYHSGCEILENAVIFPQGGASMRPGTYYVAPVRTHASKVRLYSFEFSDTQAYIIEFGNEYLRFYMNHGQILDGPDPYEIASPYQEADLFDLKFTQSADVLYIAHIDYPTAKLSRTGHAAWTLQAINFRAPATSEKPVYPATTLTPSATSGTGRTFTAGAAYFLTGDVGRQLIYGASRAVITAVGASPQPITTCTCDIIDAFPDTNPIASGAWNITGTPSGTLTPSTTGPAEALITLTCTLNAFRSADVGKYIAINGGFVLIIAFGSAASITGQVFIELTGVTGSTTWTLEDEDWNNTDGYPDALCFHQGRMWFGRGIYLWGSVVEDYENFSKGSDADTSIKRPLLAKKVNVIRWLESARYLTAGTQGGEWTVKSSSTTDPITPSSIEPTLETTEGCSNIRPIVIGQSVIFVQKALRKVIELAYRFDLDGYAVPDLTLIADHITAPGLIDVDYQQEPHKIIWYPRADGILLGLTCDRTQEVVGWHRHVTDGEVESVAVSPGLGEYTLWLSVMRTISGQPRRYIEYLKPFDWGTDPTDCFFVDCGLTYNGSPTTSISGLSHLEGKTVSILADGSVHPDRVVSSGSITLQRSVSKAHIGLKYTCIIQPSKFDATSPAGTTIGKKQRITKVTVKFLNTLGAQVGYDANHMETIYFRTTGDPMDAPPALFTGNKTVTFPKGWGDDAQVRIVQEQPLPLTVLAAVAEMEING